MDRSRFSIAIFAVAGLVLAAPTFVRAQQAPQQARTAEQQFKNIKVLKGTPANQLNTAMHLIEGELGVTCEFCHYESEQDFARDGKEPKETARKMMTMVQDINKNSFDGKQVVTCYTCHRGHSKPVNMVILPDTNVPLAEYGSEPQSFPLPTVDQILDKYTQALGGEQAIRKVKSRTIVATRDIPTGPGGTVPVPAQMEEDLKAPNLVVNINRTATYTISDGFDGTSAWAQNMQGAVANSPSPDQERAKRSADLYESVNLKSEYSRMEVTDVQSVNGRSAYVVVGYPQGDMPEKLFFDVASGLLLRKMTFLPSQTGDSPFEMDFDDYRDTGSGVKVPFLIRMIPASPRSTFGTITEIRVQKVEDNAAVDDAKFTKPASKPQPPRQQQGQ